MEISGSVAVVTGAASGIGRAIAIELARQGADVVVSDVNEERLEGARRDVEALGRCSLAVCADVSKLDDVRSLFERSVAAMGRVDILVNNAGVLISGPVDKIPVSDWEWIVGINLFGVIHGVNVFLPHMLERGSGHIVNTASIAGIWGGSEDLIPYVTTKFGVVGLSQGLAVYCRTKGIGVTVLCPGVVATNLMESSRHTSHEDGLDDVRTLQRERVKQAFRDRTWEGAVPDRVVCTPEKLASLAASAIRENTFRVFTDDQHTEMAVSIARDPEDVIAQAVRMAQAQKQMMGAMQSRPGEQSA